MNYSAQTAMAEKYYTDLLYTDDDYALCVCLCVLFLNFSVSSKSVLFIVVCGGH